MGIDEICMKRDNLILNVVLIISISFIVSCKKEIKTTYQNPVTDSAHISITNISPVISNLQFYLNNNLINLPGAPLSYGKTVSAIYVNNANPYNPDTTLLPYINIPSGYQQLGFGTYGNSNIFNTVNNNFAPSGNYSIFITDTLIHGQVKSVVLKDSVATTDSTKSQIRFINLSPDAPPLDVWAYPDAGYNGYKLFSGCAYLPNDFNSFIKAESFSVINAGPYYFEATVAGTSKVVLGGLLMVYGKRVITIYTKGYISGSGVNAIDVGVIQYEP